MDKDRIKGKMEDAAGRIKRQAGEWTGDEKAQAEGLAEQAKGKSREAVGKAKDAVRNAADDLRRRKENEQEIDRETGTNGTKKLPKPSRLLQGKQTEDARC